MDLNHVACDPNFDCTKSTALSKRNRKRTKTKRLKIKQALATKVWLAKDRGYIEFFCQKQILAESIFETHIVSEIALSCHHKKLTKEN